MKLKLSRRQFLLELMKELCKSKDVVGCLTSYPGQWPKTSSTALTASSVKSHGCWEKKKHLFAPCKSKSSFCQNCKKVCCGKHAFGKATIATYKNCVDWVL